MRTNAGFTLLEILAALLIVAVGLGAVSKVIGSTAVVLQISEERLIGSWVASNHLAELRLSRVWPAATESDQQTAMGGRPWYLHQKISTTTDPDLLRIDIEVFSDTDHERMAARMFGYLARYIPPLPPAQVNPTDK
jgi:general secretion pathway protein I